MGPRKWLLATPLDVLQAQWERLAFLELRVFLTGELRRGDIETRFGIKPAAASCDLSLYREIAPGNLDYDQASRCCRPSTSSKPANENYSERELARLSQGFADGLDLGLKQAAPCEGPGQLVQPDMEVLGAITRAMSTKRAVRVNCLSLSSRPKRRDIVPVALTDNGSGWQVRSGDGDRKRFSDFVLARVAKADEFEGEVHERELLADDEQWVRMVEMEIVPRPGVKQPKAVEADYRLGGGVLKIMARAELVGYVLRRWSFDTIPGHRLEPASHIPWLRNTPNFYGIESWSLVPGAVPSGSATRRGRIQRQSDTATRAATNSHKGVSNCQNKIRLPTKKVCRRQARGCASCAPMGPHPTT